MSGKFLIDLTDARFHVDANADVLAFIRRANPFAHSDVGSLLLDLGESLPGVSAYSPSFASCAYVVLHTESNRIFAIAFGQRGLAFRPALSERAAALADGGTAAVHIGPDWVRFAPWGTTNGPTGVNDRDARERLRRWCAKAFDAARATE